LLLGSFWITTSIKKNSIFVIDLVSKNLVAAQKQIGGCQKKFN
jgi:hypothetical protein